MLENLFLNLGLPQLLNRRPERLRIQYTLAWMLIPGDVYVRGLQIRSQGLTDQWQVTADEASGDVAVLELFDRHFHAGALSARGVSVRHRRRLDIGEPPVELRSDLTPPIPGLSNPPDPDPDQIYPKRARSWLIRLDDVYAEDVREIWVEDYRLSGSAQIVADVSLADPYVDIVATVAFLEMSADRGDAPLGRGLRGEVQLLVDSMDRRSRGAERLEAISARVRVEAYVEDLHFLDFYLAAAPWLSLAGSGHAQLDVSLQGGLLREGSSFQAEFPELLVRILHNDVTGAGRIVAEVGVDEEGLPQSRATVDFDEFAIMPDGSTHTLIEGSGFRLDAVSPDVALNVPFSSVLLEIDLPESRLPDLALYDGFLPSEVGLALLAGAGTVRGHMRASIPDSHASGELWLTADDIAVQFDSYIFTADLGLYVLLNDAQLDLGRYDLTGSTLDLTRAGLVEQGQSSASDGQRTWYASMRVRSGEVSVGAPVILQADLELTCKDSRPFVRLFVEPRDLPNWVQERLSVPHLSGEATLAVGEDTLAIAPCRVRSGDYRLDLRFYRHGQSQHGDLLVRAGPLSLGVGLRPDGAQLHVFSAQSWFRGYDVRTTPSK